MSDNHKSIPCFGLVQLFLIPFLIGLPFAILGGIELHKTYQIVQRSVAVEGIVVDNDYFATSDGSVYYPVVRFTTLDGETVRFTDDRVGSYPPAYKEGATVVVLYDPDNIRDAYIYKVFRIWFFPVFITGIGILLILVGFSLPLITLGRRMIFQN